MKDSQNIFIFLRLKDDVVFLPRTFGGGWLIDLGGDTFEVDESIASSIEVMESESKSAAHTVYSIKVGHSDFAESLESVGLLACDNSLRSKMRCLQTQLVSYAASMAAGLCGSLSPNPRTYANRLVTVAWFMLRTCDWSGVVEGWVRRGRQITCRFNLQPDQISELVNEVVGSHLLSVRCKERSLAAYLLGRACGLESRLHVGGCPSFLQLHCWADCKDALLAEAPEFNADHVVLRSYS